MVLHLRVIHDVLPARAGQDDVRQAQPGELDHGGVDGVELSRDIGSGSRPVGTEDVAAAQHVELRQIAGGHAVADRRLAAGEAVAQAIAVAGVGVRAAEKGRGLKLDQVGESLGQIGLLPRDEGFPALAGFLSRVV